MTIRLEWLRTVCYFSNIEASTLEIIGRFISEKHVPAEKVISWDGEREDAIYFVISGLVKLFAISADGREFTPRMVYGGDSFNDEKIFSSEPNALSAMSMTPALLYYLRYEDLYSTMETYPQVRANITEVLAARQRYFVRLAIELVFKRVTSRLARLLLEKDALVKDGVEIPGITRYDMAAAIGTVREMVSRALKDLESSGAIKIARDKIIILDRNRLFELSSQ